MLSSLDVVYTWVDGSRPDYQELLREYTSDPRDLNPERFRDPYQMLRYSLRSLEKHAPFVSKVHLFTCRPQVPEWLKLDHPRLVLVHHDEVIDPEFLPTFNSNVIESFLHRLPGDSEYLLYLNDDYFLGRECSISDFVTPRGELRVFGSLFGERLDRVHERTPFPSFGFLEHAPLLIHRPTYEAALRRFPEELERTRRARFRQPDDLRSDRLYRYHLLGKRPGIPRVAVPVHHYLRESYFHKIANRYPAQVSGLARVRRLRPKFLCFNDDQRDNPDPGVVQLVQDFLAEYFPEKSSWEV